jgi:hypothetical protein
MDGERSHIPSPEANTRRRGCQGEPLVGDSRVTRGNQKGRDFRGEDLEGGPCEKYRVRSLIVEKMCKTKPGAELSSSSLCWGWSWNQVGLDSLLVLRHYDMISGE